MQVVLVSTTDLASPRRDVLDRMLASMIASTRELPEDQVTLAMLFQNCADGRLPPLPPFAVGLAIDRRVSLSAARNQVLNQLARAGHAFDADTVIAFPDDDCWYPPGLLRQVVGLFRREARLDLWFCRYAPQPVPATLDGRPLAPAPMRDIVRQASSNTIFLRGSVVAALGPFDEQLGVGTPLGGAEDLDYALRAAARSRLAACTAEPLVGHRAKNAQLRARYYMSGLLVLARHLRRGTMAEFLRKIAVGLYLVLRRELSPALFVSALRRALAEGAQRRG
jgi:hypothetical protein